MRYYKMYGFIDIKPIGIVFVHSYIITIVQIYILLKPLKHDANIFKKKKKKPIHTNTFDSLKKLEKYPLTCNLFLLFTVFTTFLKYLFN